MLNKRFPDPLPVYQKKLVARTVEHSDRIRYTPDRAELPSLRIVLISLIIFIGYLGCGT